MADKEYINVKDLEDFRDEITEKFLLLCNYNDYKKLTLLRICETIDETFDKYCSEPFADVVEVRRGEWKDGCCYTRCGQVDWSKPNFCPNCGADMRGDKQ